MVNNIFKIYKKITFLLKKIISVKHNKASLCAEYALLFFEFHDVKTETSMSYKERF